MAAKKYLNIDTNNNIAEKAATVVTTGSSNEGDLVALDSSGKLDPSVLPTGVGPQTKTIAASEALTGPCFVNVWNSTGQKVRYADCTAVDASKEAHGFILASVASAANATVYFEGEASGFSGRTPGAKQYLGTTGQPTETGTTTTGQALQYLGVATSTTTIDFEPGRPVIRA